MSAWSILTLQIDKEGSVYNDNFAPTQLVMDSGIDEQGWYEDGIYYALSFGRYQERRFRAHMEDMHCPKFSGVTLALVASMEDTGDTAEVEVFKSKQRNHSRRMDGYERYDMRKGKRWPVEEREELQEEIEEQYGFKPVIEPPESTVPPDMVATI